MLTNTTIAIICAVLVFGAIAATIAWTFYNIAKQ